MANVDRTQRRDMSKMSSKTPPRETKKRMPSSPAASPREIKPPTGRPELKAPVGPEEVVLKPPASPPVIKPPASPVEIKPPASPLELKPPASPPEIKPPASPPEMKPPTTPREAKVPNTPRQPQIPTSIRDLRTPSAPPPLTPFKKETKSRSYVEQYHMQSLFREGKIQARRYTPSPSSVPSKIWNRVPNIKKLKPPDKRSQIPARKSRLQSRIPKTESTSGVRNSQQQQQQRPLVKSKVGPTAGAPEAPTLNAPDKPSAPEGEQQPNLSHTQRESASPNEKEKKCAPPESNHNEVEKTPSLPTKTPESAVVLYQHFLSQNQATEQGESGAYGEAIGRVISEALERKSTETVVLSPTDVAQLPPSTRVSSTNFGRPVISSPPRVSSTDFAQSHNLSPLASGSAFATPCEQTSPLAIPTGAKQEERFQTPLSTPVDPQATPTLLSQSPTKVIISQDPLNKKSTAPPNTAAPTSSQVVDAAVQVEYKPPLPRPVDNSSSKDRQGSQKRDTSASKLRPPRPVNKSSSSVGPREKVISEANCNSKAGSRTTSEHQRQQQQQQPGKTKAGKQHQDAPPPKKAKAVKSHCAYRSVSEKPPPATSATPTESARTSSTPRKQESNTMSKTPRNSRRPACPKTKPSNDAPQAPLSSRTTAEHPVSAQEAPKKVTEDVRPQDGELFEPPPPDNLEDPPAEFVYFSNVVLLYKTGDKMTGILRLTNNSSDGIFFRLSSCSTVPDRYSIDPKEGKLDSSKRVIIKITADGVLPESEICGDTFKIETVKTPATSYTATRRFWMNVNPAKVRTTWTKCIMRYHPQHPLFKRCLENSADLNEEIEHVRMDGKAVRIVLKDLLEDIEYAQRELGRLREMEQGNFTVALFLVAISFFVVVYLLDLLPVSNFLIPT